MEEKMMENKIEDLKSWVLQKLLKERKFFCHEIELRCQDLIQKHCLEKERRRMREKNNNLKDMWATEKVGPSQDWMYVLRKEMEKQIEEWLKKDSLRSTQETKRWRKEEEKRKEEDSRRSDEQMFMAKKLKEMEQRLYDLEISKERMERERAKEREEMIEFKRIMQADMEKEKEEMRRYKEIMHREREREKEDMKQYEAMIQRERQTEREAMWEHMEKLKESQVALQKEVALFKEERTKMEEDWRKEKEWMAKCIAEEEAEKLEMKRAMWWMRTERNQEKQQLKLYQQRDKQRTEEMEQLRRDFKDQKLRMQQEKNDIQQNLLNIATMRLPEKGSNRRKTKRKTMEMANNMSSHSGNLEEKLFSTVKDFAVAMEDIEVCGNSRLKDIKHRVQNIQEKLEQDSGITDDNMSTEIKRKKKITGFISRWFKK